MSAITATAAVLVSLLVLLGPDHEHEVARGSPTAERSVPLATTPGAVVSYASPVAGPMIVVAPFVAPATPYGAGHRGVDLATLPTQVVLAAAAGTVQFAGSVAGRGVIVIAHSDGVRTEYEPVSPTVRVGATVNRGQAIGRIAGRHRACAVGRCLHWGARRGAAYFDPLSLLRPLGPVRLVPLTAPAGP